MSSFRVSPAEFEDFGQQKGNELLGRDFTSRCALDVQPNTRIIPLCGVTDFIGSFGARHPSKTSTYLKLPRKYRNSRLLR